MVTRDIRSDLVGELVLQADIAADTTTSGIAIDTSFYDRGVKFDFFISDYTDGSYTLQIEEADDSGFIQNVAVVSDDNLIGTSAGTVLAAASVEGNNLPSLGIKSTRKFVRAQIVSTGVTTGATVSVVAQLKGEVRPETDKLSA